MTYEYYVWTGIDFPCVEYCDQVDAHHDHNNVFDDVHRYVPRRNLPIKDTVDFESAPRRQKTMSTHQWSYSQDRSTKRREETQSSSG